MSDSRNTEVTIIGAGLTGLSLGFYLHKNGIPFIILEKDTKTGGVIQSHAEDGFLFETGPNTGVIGNPEVAELFEDLGESCNPEIADPKAKKRLIWKKGKWHALPSGLLSAVCTPLFTFFDKLRILGEPFRKRGANPLESVAEMVKRRLGKSFLDYAINPFIGGIYAGKPEKLVTKYALPKMYNLEYSYGSLVKGGIQKTRANKKDPRLAKATKEVFSVKGGLHQLIKAIEKQIPAEQIQLAAESIQVDKVGNNYLTKYVVAKKTETIKSKIVVTTVGAYVLPNILSFINGSSLDAITNLNYAKVTLIILGYKEWNGCDINAFGGLVPSIEKKNILGILYTSSFFKHRAPEGGALLSMFVGGTRLSSIDEMSDEELYELAIANVKDMLDTNQAPDLFKVFRYEHAIAQYEASSKERFECIADLEDKNRGLFLAGNIRNGIGMADRIKQGKDIAEEIGRQLL